MEHTITSRDRHTLAYTDVGDPAGRPILVQHGMIASILDTHLFGSIIDASYRVISAARPGYGRSSPYEMRDIGEWGDIVAVLANALDLPAFDVLGISSGAPYAYAIAYALPDRVRRVFILSGTPALYDATLQAAWPYPITPEASIPQLQFLARALFFSDLTEEVASSDDVRDSMANDCFGIALDLRLRCRDWGFGLSDVQTPVIMQHSRLDEQVPFATAEMTCGLLPRCRLLPREGSEHFSVQVLNDFVERVVLAHT